MKKFPDKILPIVLVFTIALPCFFLGLHLIDDYDFPWHLKTGEIIFQQGPPKVDSYSFRAQGREWIDAQWLFQLLIYLVYRLFGFAGESVLLAVLVMTIFLLLLWLCWDQELYPLTFLFTLLALWVSSLRFNLRPELFTYLLMIVYLIILERNRKQASGLIYLLPLLQLLWANLEGLWPIGLFLIGVYGLEEIFLKYLSRSEKFQTWLKSEHNLKPQKTFLILILSTLASLFTPYHIKGFFFPLHLFLEVTHPSNFVKAHILDSKPVFPAWFQFPFLAVPLLFLILSSGLSFFLNRKPRSSQIIFWLVFVFISLSARRNTPFICFLSVFILSTNFQNFFSRFSWVSDSRFRAWLKFFPAGLGFCLALFFSISVPTGKFYAWDKTERKFGAGFYFEKYPKDAVAFLKSLNWKGRLYNQLAMGGFLIWAGYPEWRVYVDGRLEVYGEELLQKYLDSMTDYSLFQSETKKYGFTSALLRTRENRVIPLIQNLLADPNWALVYSDEMFMVFLQDTAEQHQLVEQYQLNKR